MKLKVKCYIEVYNHSKHVKFEVFTAVTIKDAIFWDVTLYGSCMNQCFEGMYHLHHQSEKNQ
jgi:hypothetical protein